eukprot:TRINITY_DN2870_c0_g1_i2.p1 TRINITY_DN2870_c0_g1~~TRINITY_DN2870_c0_g1_i2.p1  ORF type:complete len:761 (+),score=206.40 TRINITY_DN2870_c0_g1_i2:727-3009(+)
MTVSASSAFGAISQVWAARGAALRAASSVCSPQAGALWHVARRMQSTQSEPALPEEEVTRNSLMRNFGISAHIDSGKTTLTERILYYTGRIKQIHEVKGSDGVGATMDSMELERQKGITIQSAATQVGWKGMSFNIIDTPGHIDFTIEVERALRVLDGAIMVVCGVGSVQSQTMTVDKQMKRYKVPRIAFINKLDRMGADPARCSRHLREKLGLNSGMLQIPIGISDTFKGVVDLITMKALYFDGPNGETVRSEEIPGSLSESAAAARKSLIEKVAEVDETLADIFLEEKTPTEKELQAAIRRATLALKFVPVMMGSAFKNKGVQPLLDGVQLYLPDPTEVVNTGLDNATLQENGQPSEVILRSDSRLGFVGLAFKLEESRFGQLTYMRVYQGTLRRGDTLYNVNSDKKQKVPRLGRMHAAEMEDIKEAKSGEICALFGVDCHSGDSFTNGDRITMTSMHVPAPVISLFIQPVKRDQLIQFAKVLARFQKEDPTFRVRTDQESSQTIISGMGELHLEIYAERLKREFNIECIVGQPQVAFRETVTKRAEFNYTHKKQSGGAGQYGKVVGYIEPLPAGHPKQFEFENGTIGQSISSQFVAAVEKGCLDAAEKGSLIGFPVVGVRVVLTDGASHAVDSSELAFRLAGLYAFREAYEQAKPAILEPIMSVSVDLPSEFQGNVIGQLNRRRGVILSSDPREAFTTVEAEVPLKEMFGFSTELRSQTQGKGEFTMEYKKYEVVPGEQQRLMVEEARKKAGLGPKK